MVFYNHVQIDRFLISGYRHIKVTSKRAVQWQADVGRYEPFFLLATSHSVGKRE